MYQPAEMRPCQQQQQQDIFTSFSLRSNTIKSPTVMRHTVGRGRYAGPPLVPFTASTSVKPEEAAHGNLQESRDRIQLLRFINNSNYSHLLQLCVETNAAQRSRTYNASSFFNRQRIEVFVKPLVKRGLQITKISGAHRSADRSC